MKTFDEIVDTKKLWGIQKIIMVNSAFIKLPDCGTCSVVWGDNEDGYEHVSVSPKHKYSIPSWDDMCFLKEIFFYEEEEAYQIHPKKSEYINMQRNCLHLWKPKGHELGELVNA